MLTSVLFSGATIFVYACVHKLRNTHGIILICFLGTLAVSYSTLSFTLLWNGVLGIHTSQPACSIIAYTTYFAFLSTFFWMNVLSFHLWVGLSFLSQWRVFMQDIDHKWLITFMAYGWGMPALLTCLVLYLGNNDAVPKYLQPKFGETTCFIEGKSNGTFARSVSVLNDI